jgi:subtilisin family serine protease
LLGSQWYVPAIHAFDFWAERPSLAPVLVAVIDSGVDGSHPELRDRIYAAKSFVAGPARVDTIGHGTMVAGEIAAAIDDGLGIAGVAFPAELLVAKVVGPSGNISLEAEARAIRWAVDMGARVINLSLGGPRDPRNPERDTFSELEQRAIDYATRKGAVLVAATGNCQAVCPYKFASYPAALSHVIGVSALAEDGDATPAFSNRDLLYNDLAAPGKGIISTFPLELSEPDCEQPGYSICARIEDYRRGEGTSFAAPLVTAAAALILAQRPDLKASQVVELLKLSAADVQQTGRDAKSGFGRLDVLAALTALSEPPPPADDFEPNDDAGSRAYVAYFRAGYRVLRATLDFYEDATDIYRIRLRAGERATFTLQGPPGTDTNLILWKPGAEDVVGLVPRGLVAELSNRPGARERLRYKAEEGGWYYVQVKLSEGAGGPYRLVIEKVRP